MFGIGTEELLLILVIALVVLGPERMPKLARDLGRMVGDFRRTSDELRNEFLNADRIIDVAAASASTPTATAPVEESAPAAEIDAALPPEPLTEAAVTTAPADEAVALPPATAAEGPVDPDETTLDREARDARERLQDPARARQAVAEGWKTPTDDAGTTDRWG